ncbi:response regulator [Puniceicoccales bacterium CK1056]|uniref:histidine kinase n=1 Tax=Oceanipulchritudo coccoides TaxID=2706888 RepID=A0A6B2LXF7_9BACT|nr:ATP-binding protein [Oceanipulchritudo coccoides]NDV61238.1 response regulator [Oceanipulchritudo coccoides]
MRLYPCLLVFILGGLCLQSEASFPYQPERPSPLSESWRWHAQEALEGLTLLGCFEGDDGSVWFVSDTGLINYDGAEIRRYPAPKDLSLMPYRAGVFTRQGIIYMLLPGQIVEFKNGNYRDVFTYEGRYDMLFGSAVLTQDDTALFGTPEGIVSIKDGEARIVSQRNRRASFLLIDSRGDLWTNQVNTGVVLRYQGLSTDGPLDDTTWESFRIMPDVGAHLTLAELPDGTIWCANDNPTIGIYAFDAGSNEWYPTLIDSGAEELVHKRILVSPDGTSVIFGDKRILLNKNGKTEQLTIENFRFPLSSPFAATLSSGSMIIGGMRETIYLVDCSTNWWQSFRGLNYFCTDKEDRQWFITYDGAVVSRNTGTDEWTIHDSYEGVINTPLTLISTRDGKVWAAGRHDNDAAISIFSNGEWTLRVHPELGRRISHQSVLETRDGAVLFGSGDTDPEMTPGQGGILKYEVNGDQFTVTHYAPPRVPFRVVGIEEGPDGTIWTGGMRLSRLDDFKAIPLDSLGEFGNSWVDDFIVSETGDLWIAQWGVGLLINEGDNWFYSGEFNPSLTRGLVALHEDRYFPGQMWAATSEGLFNLDTHNWVNEPLNADLKILREGGTLFQSADGAIWLNASSRNWHFRDTGIMPGSERFEASFKTTSFKRYDIVPDTRIVEFEARVYEPGLSHFEWTGSTHWSLAQTNDLYYSYRIDDGEWTPFSKRTEVVLETQSNGAHTFEVRARTPYGLIDPTPARIEFEVIPVLWKQPWFILTMLLVVCVLVILVVIIVRQRIHHLLALEEYKMQFFTNISHELRTPLMVILGPLESLFKHVDEKGKKHLLIAQRNARKLVGLLDRLLDFRKAELGKIMSNPQTLDLVVFVRQEMDTLQPLADQKGQQLGFHPSSDHLSVAFDPKHVEIVLDNLLTNAIKYTPRGGKIGVHLDLVREEEGQATVKIQVVDTGPGIPRKELDKVFDPFYQIGGEDYQKTHSTGIGLAHTKSLIEAIGGRIYAESPVNPASVDSPGTRFVVELKLALQAESTPVSKAQPPLADEEDTDSDEATYSTEKKPLMLIVEDNDDIREFLESELSETYNVILAPNGKEGLEIARERIPDLIVSDVLMPIMNGRDLCRNLKADPLTSHIPVILLTAQKSEVNELAGLETGADDYITKPVNLALMGRRLENILLNRRKVREFISSHTRSIAINKDELPVNKIDQEFMVKFMETIEENLTSETFDVEGLAKLMFMSRMTLYRKVKALTGESPGNIIRTVRLKKAAQYLETGSWMVSQVIEKVGFLDMSHFSRSFKKEYGCTPTQYIERYSAGSVTTEEKITSEE